MKDVSKQTLESLITFIYCGEVSVKQEHWEEFHNTAKALEIKGLADGTCAKSLCFPAPKSTGSPPSQYQLNRTAQIGNPTPSNYYQRSSNGYQQQDDFNYGENNESAEKSNELGNHYDDTVTDDSSMKHQLDAQDNQWDSNYYDNQSDGGDKKPAAANVPKAKRAKPSSNGE